MDLLLIDTNVYLRFYDSSKPEYKKLIKSLVEVKDNIFITDQITNEISRNKLLVFKQSTDNYLKQSVVSSLHLPEHFDSDTTFQIAEWNKRRKQIEQDFTDHTNRLKEVINKMMELISQSTDSISIELNKIKANSKSPDSTTFDKAIKRQLVGNPPGKSEDPLGDQLTWEQLLIKVDNIQSLWIVTNDHDYISIVDNKCYLNPFLMQELVEKNPSIVVKCFNLLTEALKDFSETVKIVTLPNDEELKEIAKDEPQSDISTTHLHKIDGFDNFCPNCMSNNSLTKRININGTQFYNQYRCIVCGHVFEPEFFNRG